MKKIEEIEHHYDELKILWLNYWKEEVVFTYQWWIMVLILILPFFLWWMLVDKRRIIEISLVGLFTSGIAFILDQVGTSLRYWIYPYTLTYLERDLWLPANFSVIPFFYMMIYQWFPKWQKYILAIIVFAFFASFVGESIFKWLGIYKVLKWEHIYSVPFYIMIGVFVKIVLQKLISIEKECGNGF